MMVNRRFLGAACGPLLLSLALAACGGGIDTPSASTTSTTSNDAAGNSIGDVMQAKAAVTAKIFSIGGVVTGLTAGTQVVLSNNGASALTIGANGRFTFSTKVALNGTYAVTADSQPTGQVCTVSNGTGAGVVTNVVSVKVTCSATTFVVNGSASGLGMNDTVTLLNNRNDRLVVTGNDYDSFFAFNQRVAYNSGYSVTVATQPKGKTCTVVNGVGEGVTNNVNSIRLTCSVQSYPVGGSISGLNAGQQVTLMNNGAAPLTLSANGNFTFPAPVAYQGSYAVTVGTQPTGQVCSAAANESKAAITGAISNIHMVCSSIAYSVGGQFQAWMQARKSLCAIALVIR